MIGIDTNVLVRYFAQDDTVHSPVARRFMQRDLSAEQRGHVSLVVLAELVWVLRSRYKAKRDEIISTLEALLVAPNVVVQDASAVWVALDDCRHANISVPDALIVAVNRLHGCEQTVTFDEQATRIADMTALR